MFAHRPVGKFDSEFFVYATNFFKFCGLWRTDKRPWWMEPYVYIGRFNVRVCMTFGWGFIASVLSGCYLYQKEGDTARASSWATFALAYVTMQYKFGVLCVNEGKIRGLIKQLEQWSARYPDKSNVDRMLEICNKLLLLGALLIGIACVGYCCAPIFMYGPRDLPIKTMFTLGFDVLKSPVYEIYVVYENVGTLSNTIISIAFDIMYIGILLTTAAILRNLNTEMRRNLVESRLSSEKKYQSLLKHIMDHTEILMYLNEVRDLFMISNLLHFLYNYTNAGMTMFQLSKLPIGSLQFFAIMTGFSSQIFALMTYCESGQKITDEMLEFWNILCVSDWYKESIKFRKTVCMVLLGTSREYYMAAGKMMTLSRETEKKILNAVFAYYTFLHRLN